MATNAPQSMQPPQVPSTPVVAQQALNELVDYYYQLADYHRSSVNYYQQLVEHHSSEIELVEKQLSSVEALLNPLTESGAVDRANETSQQETSTDSAAFPDKSAAVAKIEENIADLPDEDKEIATESTSNNDVSANDKSTDNSKSMPDEELEENASEDTSSASEESTTARDDTESIETTDAKKNKAKADSKSKNSHSKATGKGKKTQSKTKAKKSYSSRLPQSPLIEPYETIADAVVGCLQEHYPQVMSADDILKYYYPKGLSGETKKRAYGAFSNTLSKGAGNKGWIRESIGKYRWREGI